MQTFITDKDFYKSASNLTRHHLQANIYESIQILASLLDYNNKLVNPKKNVKNHPAAKLWKDYESQLLLYIDIHIREWEKRGYKTNINYHNHSILFHQLNMWGRLGECGIKIPWITDELIQTHRSVLIQKEIEKEKKDKNKIKPQSIGWYNEQYRHYRNLWADCPINLQMRYDWRLI
jgi:hypothetical protein